MSYSAILSTVAHQAPLSMGFPSKNTGVDCHFLLQGIFPTQGLGLLCLLQVDSLPLSHQGNLVYRSLTHPLIVKHSKQCFCQVFLEVEN